MPGRNGTGPNGRGPATGRGMGGCRPVKDAVVTTDVPVDGTPVNVEPGVGGRGLGLGLGRQGGGRGAGRGRGTGRGAGRGLGRNI